MRPTFFHHLHPPTIPAQQARWRYTLGAGGAAVFLSLVLLLTGVLLTFYYVPTPQEATLSLQTITFHVPLGRIVRYIHYWSAQLLVILAAVHLGRVLLSGAYTKPRRFNYILGLLLFVLILFLDFTGYVLRWDSGIHWALVVGTNLLKSVPWLGDWLYAFAVGGSALGASTLLRFYAWHIFGLTIPFIFGVGWHIFRLRRDGGIAVPPSSLRREAGRIKRNELVRREALAALWISTLLLVLAVVFPAALSAPIQEAALPAEARAPWFFVWVQALLRLGDPFWMGIVVPLAALLVLGLIPFTLPQAHAEELGRWLPRNARPAQIVFAVLVLGWVLLTVWDFVFP